MKRALVTGGTRGIGLAVCRLLAEKGYAVTALYLRNEAAAELARKELPSVRFVRADVRDEAAVQSVIAALPGLDVVVNNAGVALFSQVQDTTHVQYQDVMDTNMGGVFLVCKHAVRKLIESRGTIVNLSSVWGETGGSCESVYSASKGAIIAFSKALAKELAPSEVTVNCVSPGAIETEMNARLSQGEKAALCEEIPLGRFGSPEEVAAAVCFLIENRYITGQVLSVNGGFHI